MTVLNQQQQAELKGYVNRGDYHGGWTYLAKQGDRVEISSVVYSISGRILKHEHAQKHPSPPVSGFGYPQRHHAPSRVAAAANLLGRGHHHRNTHHPRHARTRRKNPPLQRLERRV